MKYDFNGYQWRHRIETVSCGPLVYVRNLKCGSTGYYNFFKDRLRWQEIEYMDIDWDQQTVFGHIMDPCIRRCKGLAEYLEMTGLISLFNENASFQIMVKNLPCADQHSMSYYDTFGKHMVNQIQWIPIGDDHDKVHELTKNFLRLHNISVYNIVDSKFNYHTGSEGKKAVSKQLLDHWYEHHQELDIVKWYLEKDHKLWNHVLRSQRV